MRFLMVSEFMKRKSFFSVLIFSLLFVLVSCVSFSTEKSDTDFPLSRQDFSVVCSGKILFGDFFGEKNEENNIKITLLRGVKYSVFSPFVSFEEGLE